MKYFYFVRDKPGHQHQQDFSINLHIHDVGETRSMLLVWMSSVCITVGCRTNSLRFSAALAWVPTAEIHQSPDYFRPSFLCLNVLDNEQMFIVFYNRIATKEKTLFIFCVKFLIESLRKQFWFLLSALLIACFILINRGVTEQSTYLPLIAIWLDTN